MVQVIQEQGFLEPFTQALGQIATLQLQQKLQGQQNVANLQLAQQLGLVPKDVDVSQFSGASPQFVKSLTQNQRKTSAAKNDLSQDDRDQLIEFLVQDGMPRNQAEIYSRSTPGVQQSMSRIHEDLKLRGIRNPIAQQGQDQIEETNQPLDQVSEERSDFAWPEIPDPEGTTPAERVKIRAQNQKENNAALVKARDKRQAAEKSDIRFSILRNINDSDKLPSGMGKFVIDTSGNIRPTAQLAGLVNKETQDFVKTIADFISDAKNFFGARVTNFDLETFMRRLPNLLNSPEGRRLVIEQMDLLNQLEVIHSKAETDALQHYGNRANLADILGVVDNEVAGQELAVIDKINRLHDASDKLDMMFGNPDRFRDHELMMAPDGSFKAVHKKDRDEAINKFNFRPWHD